MARILVRTTQNPLKVFGPAESAERMGKNSGNWLYANAVVRSLSNTSNKVTSAANHMGRSSKDELDWVARINGNFDHLVLPMSNAFRHDFGPRLQRFTDIIRQLDVPVTVVGVGAQTSIEAATSADATSLVMTRSERSFRPDAEAVEQHNARVLDFITAVLDRSSSIGVRGQVTKDYLVSLGVPEGRVDVIGCPSLFTWGPDLRVTKTHERVTRRSRISMNIDHRVPGIGDIVARNAALYPNLTSPVQDLVSAQMIITGTSEFNLDGKDLNVPIHVEHPLFTSSRLLFYPNAWGWIESFKEQRFAFGSRLHGNIAALLAGTPAYLLAHDSRTLELADYHGIPYSLIDEVPKDITAAQLYERADYAEFNRLQPIRFQTYLDFLHRNGLTTIWDPYENSRRFDKRIEAGKSAGPAVSGSASISPALIKPWHERLRDRLRA